MYDTRLALWVNIVRYGEDWRQNAASNGISRRSRRGEVYVPEINYTRGNGRNSDCRGLDSARIAGRSRDGTARQCCRASRKPPNLQRRRKGRK